MSRSRISRTLLTSNAPLSRSRSRSRRGNRWLRCIAWPQVGSRSSSRRRMVPSCNEYAFSEPVTATTMSREHIREVINGELFHGGGIPNTALCGYDIRRGWDVPTGVTRQRVARGMSAEVNPTCEKCATIWRIREDQS